MAQGFSPEIYQPFRLRRRAELHRRRRVVKNNKYSNMSKDELMGEVKSLSQEIESLKRNPASRFGAEVAANPGESIFLKIAASTLDAIIMVDSEGNVSFWNNAAERMFGYSVKEAIGKPIHGLIIPSPLREAHIKGFEKFRKTGSGPVIGKILELEAIRKDGETFPVELSLSAVKTDEGWNAVGVVRDISERKILEERFRTKLDELERMNNLMVGRELKMEELRKEIRRLRAAVEKSRKETPGQKEAR